MRDYKKEQIDNELGRQAYIKKSDDIALLINAIPLIRSGVDVSFDDIEWQIERYAQSYDGFDENPDFQRGHVWTEDQQIKFIEAIVRGTIGDTGRTITLNCPEFNAELAADSDLKGFVVVDGLQRLTACRRFMKDEFKIFKEIDGGVDKDYFNKSRFNFKSNNGLRFNIMNLQYKYELLNYYLAFNDGGTVHSQDEIDRVKTLRDSLL